MEISQSCVAFSEYMNFMSETGYFLNEYSKNRSLWWRRRRRLGPQTPERKQSLFVLLKKYSSSSFSDLYRDGCCVQEGLNWKRGSGCKNKFFFQVYWSSSILAPQTYVWHLSHIFRGREILYFLFCPLYKGGLIPDRFCSIVQKIIMCQIIILKFSNVKRGCLG